MQFTDLVRILVLQFQENRYADFGTLIWRAFHMDRAIHHVHNVFCDCHSKARTLYFCGAVVIRTSERLKHDFLKFRRHADAVILYRKFITAKV